MLCGDMKGHIPEIIRYRSPELAHTENNGDFIPWFLDLPQRRGLMDL